MTGYVKADSYSALIPTDTFNGAFGKLEAGLNALQDVIFKQYLTVSLTSNISLFEANVSAQPNLTISVKFNGEEVTPTTLSLKKAGTEVLNTPESKSYSDTTGILTTTTYEVTISYQGVTKSASVTVRSYYAMYFGGNPNTTLTQEQVLALNKQAIKASAAGNYSIELNQADYGWYCVPTEFTINKMTSSGFDVPLEAPVTVAVNGHDYKCYRTSQALAAGTMNVVIS